MSNNETAFAYVARMNEAFGNPRGNPDAINWKRLSKQCDGVREEIGEFSDELKERNWIKVRDALCDTSVFALGAYHFMGLEWDATMSEDFGTFNMLDYDAAHLDLLLDAMDAGVRAQSVELTTNSLRRIIAATQAFYAFFDRFTWEADMRAVLDGVMTRFCHDEDELARTKAKFDALGVTYYQEGAFPAVCLKSSTDQVDAKGQTYHEGKFLKAIDYKETVFAE